MHRWVLIVVGRNVSRKMLYNFPPRLTGISALLCKTGNTEITSFHLKFVCGFAANYHISAVDCIHLHCRVSVPRELVSKDIAADASETVQLNVKELLSLGARSVQLTLSKQLSCVQQIKLMEEVDKGCLMNRMGVSG